MQGQWCWPLLHDPASCNRAAPRAAEELGDFVPLVGGAQHAHFLLQPLEALATVDETVVREKAVASICSVTAQMKGAAVQEHLLPLVQRLAAREWPARVSACKLFATAYPPAQVGGTLLHEFMLCVGHQISGVYHALLQPADCSGALLAPRLCRAGAQPGGAAGGLPEAVPRRDAHGPARSGAGARLPGRRRLQPRCMRLMLTCGCLLLLRIALAAGAGAVC